MTKTPAPTPVIEYTWHLYTSPANMNTLEVFRSDSVFFPWKDNHLGFPEIKHSIVGNRHKFELDDVVGTGKTLEEAKERFIFVFRMIATWNKACEIRKKLNAIL